MTQSNKITNLLLIVLVVGYVAYVLEELTEGWEWLPGSHFWRWAVFFGSICIVRLVVKRLIYNNGKIKIVKKD